MTNLSMLKTETTRAAFAAKAAMRARLTGTSPIKLPRLNLMALLKIRRWLVALSAHLDSRVDAKARRQVAVFDDAENANEPELPCIPVCADACAAIARSNSLLLPTA
ncbi:hypothetical protein [Paraburkholderia aspalathi]|uniref:hypothetical protein n=1 Tax=Paraburkholderia aspalathi TaxID=1324617 RepID=UPI001BA91640|nr:hypothetical protein [Paraburkholderia aspalathi]